MKHRTTLPEIIRTAGEDAVRAYRKFLDDPARSPNTRRVHRNRVRRFLRWAEGQGLTLRSITPDHWLAFTFEAGYSPAAASHARTPVARLFMHLVAAGVPTISPFFPQRRRNRHRPWPTVTLNEIKAAMHELGDWEEDSVKYRAALVVLAPLAIGTMRPGAVAAFSGVPEPQVCEYAGRLRRSGVWRRDWKLDVWGDTSGTGATALEDLEVMEVILDVAIAIGDDDVAASTGAGGGRGCPDLS
jgi:hypothetical protein